MDWKIYFIVLLIPVLGYYLVYRPLRQGRGGMNLSSEESKSLLAKDLDYLFIFMPIDQINILRMAGMLGLGFLFFILGYRLSDPGPVLAAAMGMLVGYFAPEITIYWLKFRRIRRFSDQVVDSLVLLSNGLRAGFSMELALKMLAEESPNPMGQEIQLILREYDVSGDLDDCLMKSAERIQDADFELAMNAVYIARQMGGNIAEIFDRIVAMIRERKGLEGKARSATAQGRLQAIVVGLLPICFAYAMSKVNPDLLKLMYTTVPGVVVLFIVFVLDVVGYSWTIKLSKIEY